MIPPSLLDQTVQVESYLGDTAVGPTWGDPVSQRARMQPRRRMVRDREGRETVSDATVYLPPETVIGPDDRLTWGGRTYRVMEARPHQMHGRTQYIEAVLG